MGRPGTDQDSGKRGWQQGNHRKRTLPDQGKNANVRDPELCRVHQRADRQELQGL